MLAIYSKIMLLLCPWDSLILLTDTHRICDLSLSPSVVIIIIITAILAAAVDQNTAFFFTFGRCSDGTRVQICHRIFRFIKLYAIGSRVRPTSRQSRREPMRGQGQQLFEARIQQKWTVDFYTVNITYRLWTDKVTLGPAMGLSGPSPKPQTKRCTKR